MHFLMNIIRLLEQRAPMLLLEIKNALDCTISTTFEFGYPNLYTVISTHSDIFYINLGVTLERSEVGLVGNTECKKLLDLVSKAEQILLISFFFQCV